MKEALKVSEVSKTGAEASTCALWGSFRLDDCRFNHLLLLFQIAANVLWYEQSVKLSACKQMAPNVSAGLRLTSIC